MSDGEKRSYWRDLADRARDQIARFREEKKEQIEKVTGMIEVHGGALLMGIWHGYNGAMPLLFGVPHDLLAAAVLQIVAFGGYGGGYEDHIHHVANGIGAYYVGSIGQTLGQKLRRRAKKMHDPERPWTDEELRTQGLQNRNLVSGAAPYPQMAGVPQGFNQFTPEQQRAMYGWGAAA